MQKIVCAVSLFACALTPFHAIAHDLAVTSIRASKRVSLSAAKPTVTKSVSVAIQNLSPYPETIQDLSTLARLVNLSVIPVTTGSNCPSPVPVLRTGRPQPVMPAILKPKRTLRIVFDVTFNCAVDPLKGSGHEDFHYIAQVDASVLDGQADIDPASDVCPRSPIPVVDGSKPDKGCGGRLPGRILGGPVLSDVVLKEGASCPSPVAINPSSVTQGALETGDCSVVQLFPTEARDKSLLDLYSVTLPLPGELTIGLASDDFDAFVALLDAPPVLPQLAEDDDSGGELNSLITIELAAGTYIIMANSATVGAQTGNYILTTEFAPFVWSTMSSQGAPESRKRHTAVWTGSEMTVWGGDDGNSLMKNSGGRFDPATNNWTATSLVDAPSPRSSHTAVWTGDEMLVWGGFSGAFNFLTMGDGASYSPQLDRWSVITANKAPSARTDHTAVWTGTEMIVWGGAACIACTNGGLGDGARYNPATGSWTSITNTGAPAARFNHTAVWTGSRMIVWGGENDTGTLTLLNSGGVYDPATDSWQSMSIVSALMPTRCHSAVWTGTKMIIFGGQTNSSLGCGISSNNSGAAYDPLTDTWTAIADAPFSSGISGPKAIWSGDSMITWFDTAGARYDPASDTWRGVSMDSAPSGRRFHTLVWTGTQMIVWGGQWAGTLGDGKVYSPDFDMTP